MYHIRQRACERVFFDRTFFPFVFLSNANSSKFSVKHVVLSKHSHYCSVKICWNSVKHWWLHWQCAVLSKSTVMFDRTILAFDRITFRCQVSLTEPPKNVSKTEKVEQLPYKWLFWKILLTKVAKSYLETFVRRILQ